MKQNNIERIEINITTLKATAKKKNKKDQTFKANFGKINNKWALFEYEPKLNKIFFKNDTLIKKNQINKIEIEIQDLVGNSKVVIDSLQF